VRNKRIQRRSFIIVFIYRSDPERVRHAFGVHVLPEGQYAANIRAKTVNGVTPERQNISLPKNARHVCALSQLLTL